MSSPCFVCDAKKFGAIPALLETDSIEHDHELADAMWHLVATHGSDGVKNSGFADNEIADWGDSA